MINVNDNTILNPDNVVIAEQKGSMYKLTLINGKILYVNKDVYEDIIAYEGGGGGSTAELYEHNISITTNWGTTSRTCYTHLLTNSSTPLTYVTLAEALYNRAEIAGAYGTIVYGSSVHHVMYINGYSSWDTFAINAEFADMETSSYGNAAISSSATIIDTVVKLI